MPIIKGLLALAEYYDRSPSAVRAWFYDRHGHVVKHAPFTQAKNKTYTFNTEDIEPWLDEHRPTWRSFGEGKAKPLPDAPKKLKRQKDNLETQDRLDLAKTEKAEAAADRAEIESDQRSTQYATVKQASKAHSEVLAFIQAELEAFCKAMTKQHPAAGAEFYKTQTKRRATLLAELRGYDFKQLATPKTDMPPR